MKAHGEDEIAALVCDAREKKRGLEIVAGGTRRGCGRPMEGTEILDVSGIAGILRYEPEELILTARPATPISEIAAVLAAKGQRLGFDPADWALLFGATGAATLGGALSADASGPAAVRFGRARESLLGVRAVNGLGEAFKAGGKVVKNVTGFDIPKLVCGAFGTLCVLTEVTFRVFPKPEASATLAVRGMDMEDGLRLLREVRSSALEPTGLAYVPGGTKFAALGDAGAALVRVEGASAPLDEKLSALREMIGRRDVMSVDEGDALFTALGAGHPFAGTDLDIWRIAVPTSMAARVVAEIAAPLWYADWAGGLLWIGTARGEAGRMRGAAGEAGGHAMLLRADAAVRAKAGLFAPQDGAHAALSRAVKSAFDPFSLFNPDRL